MCRLFYVTDTGIYHLQKCFSCIGHHNVFTDSLGTDFMIVPETDCWVEVWYSVFVELQKIVVSSEKKRILEWLRFEPIFYKIEDETQ